MFHLCNGTFGRRITEKSDQNQTQGNLLEIKSCLRNENSAKKMNLVKPKQVKMKTLT